MPRKLKDEPQVCCPLLTLVELRLLVSSKKIDEMVSELSSGTPGECGSVLATGVYRQLFGFNLPPEMVHKIAWIILNKIVL